MKKLVSVLLVLVLVSAGLFALDLDMSAGGVVDFTGASVSSKISKDSKYRKVDTNISFIGFKGYFDAQYAVAEIGMNLLAGKVKNKTKDTFLDTSKTTDYEAQISYLNMGIFGKYPFAVTEKIKVFPLLGLDFDIPLSVKFKGPDGKFKEANDEGKKELNRVWLDLGAGADFFVTDNLYVRPQAMFGIKLNETKSEKDAKKTAKDMEGKYSNFGYKFNIGVGVGYKF